MNISFETIELIKRYPLRISRGEITRSTNLIVRIEDQGLVGIGEAAPGSTTGAETAEECQIQLEGFLRNHDVQHSSIYDSWSTARESHIAPCAYAALDMALWDLLARQSGQPLYKLLGLARRSVATSVTVGILPPEVVRERVPEILHRTGAKFLKVKLGSPEGIDADQAMFDALHHITQNMEVDVRVDANGGWNLQEAKTMIRWLADRGVEYIEQPLVHGEERQLPALFQGRALPIYVDESCNFSSDIPAFAQSVDGVNLKLMKCGGITEALRIVATARAHKLKTMIGCMGESSISISAGASIAALFDYVDLDSQLNLLPDPATGAILENGIVLPTDAPGHGASLC